jgi:hypothetical protein
MSNRSIATHQSYDPYDCTSTGYDFTLYSDGSVAVEGHSCWQGSTSGERYRSNPDTVDLSTLNESDPDNDAEAMLAGFVATFDSFDDLPSEYSRGNHGFRCTRKGYRIQ